MKTKSKNKNFIFFIKFLFQINIISCINSNKENENIPENEDFFKIQNILGKEIMVKTLSNNQFSIENKGVYFLKIELENGQIVNRKIVIN